MENKDLEKRTEGTSAALKVLSEYMTKRELVNVRKLLRKENLTSSDVGKYFEKNRAKDIHGFLQEEVDNLREYKNVKNLWWKCELFYDENTEFSMIDGDALNEKKLDGIVRGGNYVEESLY